MSESYLFKQMVVVISYWTGKMLQFQRIWSPPSKARCTTDTKWN